MGFFSWLFGGQSQKSKQPFVEPASPNEDLFVAEDNGELWVKAWRELGDDMDEPHFDVVNDKAVAYIREKMSINRPNNREKDVQVISDFLSGNVLSFSGGVYSAKVDGVSTCGHAEKEKDNLLVMLRCCEEEIRNMAATGLAAAPFYFKRVAILAKKQKNYELEIKICEVLIAAYHIYAEAYALQCESPLLNMSGVAEEMEKRLLAARKNLELQRGDASKQIPGKKQAAKKAASRKAKPKLADQC